MGCDAQLAFGVIVKGTNTHSQTNSFSLLYELPLKLRMMKKLL